VGSAGGVAGYPADFADRQVESEARLKTAAREVRED
jgi:hypothetical protein